MRHILFMGFYFMFLLSQAQVNIQYQLLTKTPGNNSISKEFTINHKPWESGGLKVSEFVENVVEGQLITLTIESSSTNYINLKGNLNLEDFEYGTTQFYLPGFWYKKNLRSPENAPSSRSSKSWIFREDRLSTPLTGAYSESLGKGYSLSRKDIPDKVALTAIESGEVILSGYTNLGALGFEEQDNKVALSFSMPYREAPKTYYRKLTLGDETITFIKLGAGEKLSFQYLLRAYSVSDYADFVAQCWTNCYDQNHPEPLSRDLPDSEVKEVLSQFWRQSVIELSGLKGYSGAHLKTKTCESIPYLEVGFTSRVLLNAFNSLEYGYEQQNQGLVDTSYDIWNSYLKNGFTPGGLLREAVKKSGDTDKFSIRRQSEGIYATLFYLQYERQAGRGHPEWEKRVVTLLERFASLQNSDGSFPRKFDDKLNIKDSSGGSSSCTVPPLVMASQYFKDEKYLMMARKVAEYQEREIIGKSDYFSSTLDANCEDKEASLYSTTALYYLAQATKGKERGNYIELAKKASYFALSWYYTWDVPFAQGQMLGDLGFHTRGWGNVSVENNHVDVYIFEFDEILDWLAVETKEPRFSSFSEVIRSSMRSQLLPYLGHMAGGGKVGYHPEVIQHTNWDYGHNGKGFYNDNFAPGWVVASLWELLTVGRTQAYFKK